MAAYDKDAITVAFNTYPNVDKLYVDENGGIHIRAFNVNGLLVTGGKKLPITSEVSRKEFFKPSKKVKDDGNS